MNNSLKGLSFLVFFIAVYTLPVQAQLFSADQRTVTRQPLNVNSFITLSLEPVDFVFKGEATRAPLGNVVSNDLSFNNATIRVALETPLLLASLGLGGSYTGLPDRRSYVDL